MTRPTTQSSQSPETIISAHTGWSWWKIRHQLLHGSADGPCRLETLDDGILRHTPELPRDLILRLVGLTPDPLPETMLKQDRKRSIFRIQIDNQSFILKKFHCLHRWLAVSPDTRGWLGAHRLRNDVPCYAWFRRHDLSQAIIVYADAGDRDLYMLSCLQSPSPHVTALFRQAGVCIAALHHQNIFHADTKPTNFVYHSHDEPHPAVQLIDTDDIRLCWHLSRQRQARNLAQFIGCTRPDLFPPERYAELLAPFLQGYRQQSGLTTPELLQLLPMIRQSVLTLYPDRQQRNQPIIDQLKYLIENPPA